jgi:hypothetical protein
MGTLISKYKKKALLPIIKSNFNKLSQREIARRIGIGKTSVNRWSKELGLFVKKHIVNEHFFDELDKNSAYILGFIYADGNVAWDEAKGYYTLTITAAEKDKVHLEAIRSHLSSTKPLLYSESTKSYRMIVNNKTICKKLISLGVIPRKSLVVSFPKLPANLQSHFIRGVVDGDGNVRYVSRKRSPYFEITISSGSKGFLISLADLVDKNIGIQVNLRKIGTNTYQVQYSCAKGKKFGDYIYSDASLYLERKYKEYKISGGKKDDK